MGFFSKTVYKANVDYSVLTDSKNVPDTILTALIDSVLTKSNIADTIVEGVVNGPIPKFNKMYKYGRDKYPIGLPKYKITTQRGLEATLADLQTYLPNYSSSTYIEVLPYLDRHFMWKNLHENYDYDTATNSISSNHNGYITYVLDMVVVLDAYEEPMEPDVEQSELELPEFSTYRDYETPAKERNNPLTISSPYSEIYEPDVDGQSGLITVFGWEQTDSLFKTKEIKSEVFVGTPYLILGTNQQYLLSKYEDTSGNTVYYEYAIGSGGDLVLDEELDITGTNTDGMFMPMAHVRSEHTSFRYKQEIVGYETTKTGFQIPIFQKVPRDEDDIYYTSTKKIMRMIGLDYDEIERIVETEIEDLSGSNLTYVEETAIIFATPGNTPHRGARKYIMEYFYWLRAKLGVPDGLTMGEQIQWHKDNTGRVSVNINDSIYGFTTSFTYSTVTEEFTSNHKKGSYISSITPIWISSITGEARDTRPTGTYPGDNPWEFQLHSLFNIRHQIEEDRCIVLTVQGLQTGYTGSKKGFVGGLHSVSDKVDTVLIFPLSRHIVQSKLNYREREQAYFGSMGLLNVMLHQYEKMRGWVPIFMYIVAIVITVVSFGYAWQAGAAIVAAAATLSAAVVAIVIAVLKYILIAIIVQVGFRLLARALGPELAFVLALIAAAVSGGLGAGGVISPNTTSLLMSQVANFADASVKETSKQIKGIQKEQSKLQAEYISEQERIDAMIEELRPRRKINQATIMRMGESVDHYYGRLIHSGNIGVKSFDVIPNYVNIMKRLPDGD